MSIWNQEKHSDPKKQPVFLIGIISYFLEFLSDNLLTARYEGRMNAGLKSEIECSIEFHNQGVPLLVSSSLLRARNLGQIDLARLRVDSQGWLIEIGEVKSSRIGVEQMERSQKRRLFSSQHFLSGVFGHRSKLIAMAKKNEIESIILVGFVLVLQKFPTFINLVA